MINPALTSSRPLALVSAPVTTRSGYGDSARDFVHHLLALDKYEVKIWAMPWGSTPMNALDKNNPKDKKILDCILNTPTLPRQPELFVQITVPNEFQPIGKYNIGYTAGIETTLCDASWIEGCNRMDLVLATSEHSKMVFENTKYTVNDKQGNQVGTLELKKPIEVFHNCIDPEIFKKIEAKDVPQSINDIMDRVPENFGFLSIGHWLQGELGEDRKNIGMVVKVFLETFKKLKVSKQPCLFLKTSGATFSVLDREEILHKINSIRATVVGGNLPNVYLIHGDLTPEEMNGLMNHPKVKVHVSFTKGEGFGMPLLQATMSMKPLIVSGWSGHMDFLNKEDTILIGGELKPVGKSAVWDKVILPESQWFNIDYRMAGMAMAVTHKEYAKWLPGAKKLMRKNRELFSCDVMVQKLQELDAKYIPKLAVPMPLVLPALRKIE